MVQRCTGGDRVQCQALTPGLAGVGVHTVSEFVDMSLFCSRSCACHCQVTVKKETPCSWGHAVDLDREHLYERMNLARVRAVGTALSMLSTLSMPSSRRQMRHWQQLQLDIALTLYSVRLYETYVAVLRNRWVPHDPHDHSGL